MDAGFLGGFVMGGLAVFALGVLMVVLRVVWDGPDEVSMSASHDYGRDEWVTLWQRKERDDAK